MLRRVRERQWNKKNKHRVPATYQEGDWVLVHHSRLPAWPRSTSDDPYFGPYKEMAKEGFYLVTSVLSHRYCQGWRFITLWEGFGVKEASWEPFSAFVLPEGRLNSVLVDYLSQNNLGELLRLAETLASKTKARD